MAPGQPALLPATDSGVSNSDDITNFDNSTPAKMLQFSVPGTVVGNTVTIYADGIAIGSDRHLNDNGCHHQWDNATEQRRALDHRARDILVCSANSPALLITIETVAVTPPPPVLDPGSQSGVSNTVTNTTSPTIDVTAGESRTVYLERDGNPSTVVSQTVTGAG